MSILRMLREGKNTTDIAQEYGVSIDEGARLISLYAGRRRSGDTPEYYVPGKGWTVFTTGFVADAGLDSKE